LYSSSVYSSENKNIRKHFKIEIMKTKISQLAAITLFALIILVGNVNAKGTELDVFNLVTVEENLELEDWMTNENLWTGEATLIIEQEIDDNLKMEDWMINENNWNTTTPIIIEKEAEEKLDIEPWMTNENIWKK
jgi:hypothetical protein